MVVDKEVSEREKWQLLQRAQEASERCLLFRTELEQKDKLLNEFQRHLSEVNLTTKRFYPAILCKFCFKIRDFKQFYTLLGN